MEIDQQLLITRLIDNDVYSYWLNLIENNQTEYSHDSLKVKFWDEEMKIIYIETFGVFWKGLC